MPTSPTSTSDRGVIYVAGGAQYLAEAALSAASVRETNPGLPVFLVTHSPVPNPEFWDKIITVPPSTPCGAIKLCMNLAPWERCLFLDSDTLVVDSLAPAFALLDRFDLAAVQHSGGHHYTLPGLPASFPEFNSGVIAWRRNPLTASFFARWHEHYHRMIEPVGRTWDQKSLRLALYESDLRITSLPHGYNLMPYAPAVVENKTVVLHGRNTMNLRRLQARMAATTRLRAYVPGIGALEHPCAMTWPRLLNAMFRMLAWKMVGTCRKCTHRGAA